MDHLFSLIKKSIPPIHSEGYRFILIFAGVSFLLGIFSGTLLWIGIILTAWCAYFFRDPERFPPESEDVILSPADGVVQMITTCSAPKELALDPDTQFVRVSIFLNVFDVHVNRVPASGKITFTHYHPGKFLSADLDKASEENERQLVMMETIHGKDIIFVQIAGLVARRILCDLKEGDVVRAGDRFGIIRFGSRMDVYFPEGTKPEVRIGQRAVGGETILAHVSGKRASK